jgi:hypothetical protein
MNTARRYLSQAGTYTSAVAFGGETASYLGNTEEYNDPYYDNLTITTTV